MLNFITKSKIKQKFFVVSLSSEKAYYISEVAKIAKTSSGTAQRELEKLANSGFLERKKANLAYFIINKENPLLDDVKSIVAKQSGWSSC